MNFDISALWFAFGVAILASILNKTLVKMGKEDLTDTVDLIAYLVVFGRVLMMIYGLLTQTVQVFNL